MDEVEVAEQRLPPPGAEDAKGTIPPSAPSPAAGERSARAGRAPTSFVYALGRVEPRLPSLAVEKEVAQATGRAQTEGMTDRQSLQSVLADGGNRYLARQLCWVFTIEGLETYVLTPRDPADLDLLIESVRPEPSGLDVDVVIGVCGPMVSADRCNGLMVPVVAFDQLYSFDRDELINEIPRPKGAPAEKFRATAAELLDRIMQVADNSGATDEHRALNYLAVRYPAIYARAAEAHAEALPSRPSRSVHRD